MNVIIKRADISSLPKATRDVSKPLLWVIEGQSGLWRYSRQLCVYENLSPEYRKTVDCCGGLFINDSSVVARVDTKSKSKRVYVFEPVDNPVSK